MAWFITPCVVADTTVVGPVAIPTSEAPGPAVLKKTRSPVWMPPLPTEEPMPNCAKLVRGIAIPARRIAQLVRPEQSKELGPVAPEAYGEPTLESAADTAAWTPEPAGVVVVLAATVRVVASLAAA